MLLFESVFKSFWHNISAYDNVSDKLYELTLEGKKYLYLGLWYVLHRSDVLLILMSLLYKLLYMFRMSQHPSSGVLKTVTAASGTGHNTGAATSLQHGLIRPRWREVAVPTLWPVPEAAVTVFSTPDDGCCDTRNM